MNTLFALLASPTVQTVALGAAVLGALSGVLGTFALLRRQSLLGDALSHAALPGVCLGFMLAGQRSLPAMLAGALVTATLAAMLMMLIVRRTRLKQDAALGITLSLFFAIGLVLLTRIEASGGGAQSGLSTFLFGQAAAMLRQDVQLIAVVAFVCAITLAMFWKQIVITVFDADFARVSGYPVAAIEFLLTICVAIAIVLGLQIVGVVLMVSLLIAPAAAARQWSASLGTMALLAALFGAGAGLAGTLVSAAVPGLATGPLIVLVASLIVVVSLLFAPGRGMAARWLAGRARSRGVDAGQVLATLDGLAAMHGNALYPTEQGMVSALHGKRARRALSRLEADGLVRSVVHPPETTPHYELTPSGRAMAHRQRQEREGPQ
jgi:manganese/zinc/iron transport system permease protein